MKLRAYVGEQSHHVMDAGHLTHTVFLVVPQLNTKEYTELLQATEEGKIIIEVSNYGS